MVEPFDYVEARADAEELIAEFGQTGAIRRAENSGPAYDPVQTTTDHPCRLVEVPTQLQGYGAQAVPGSLIQATDCLVYVSTEGLAIEPALSDMVLIGGLEHSIVTLKPLSPAGLVVAYELVVRR